MTNGPTGRRLDPSKHGSTFPVTRESQNQTFRTIGFAVLVPCKTYRQDEGRFSRARLDLLI